jgi:opacity protein-like surface antigen
MESVRGASLGVAFLLAAATPAMAQGSAPVGRGFVGGLGGLTFGTVTGGAAAGQVGVELVSGVHVIGEFGRMSNVLPKEIRDDIDDLVDALELEFGVPITFEVAAPATYGFGGVRWSQQRGRLSPFAEGGVGAANVKVEFADVEIDGIDFTDELNDVLDDEEDADATKFLLALGAGANVMLTDAVSVDLGYRYTRIFTEDPSVNSSMVYGAVKIAWR